MSSLDPYFVLIAELVRIPNCLIVVGLLGIDFAYFSVAVSGSMSVGSTMSLLYMLTS